jgi:hypothetical protein
MEYDAARTYFYDHYGSKFQEDDLWLLGIPTLGEYGQWVSAQSQYLYKRFFTNPGDAVSSTFLKIYRLDIDMVRALGARFLITDLNLTGRAGVTRLLTESRPGATSVHLYRIDGAAAGPQRPNRFVTTDGNAGAIFDAMEANRRDLGRLAVLGETLDTASLVEPADTSMLLVRDGYRLRATSAGTSAILLPIQFSRCLKVTESRDGGAPTKILRANLIQTLVVFEKTLDATIQFEFGFFGNTACRRQDHEDLKRLGVK